MSDSSPRVLIVDLNNFARYPTLAVGLLTAILRQHSFNVTVFSPLSTGITGVQREPRPRPWGPLTEQLRHWTLNTRLTPIRALRGPLQRWVNATGTVKTAALLRAFERQLADADVVLISTYLVYFDECRQLVAACRRANVPVLLGGSYFFTPEVAKAWLSIDGIAGIVGGEVETALADIVTDVIANRPLTGRPGIWNPVTRQMAHPPPLQQLDDLPFPDYADFPWTLYPNRIVPIITGRGCGWGACVFCSDVTSSAGRRFRSRSPDNVLRELAYQHRRHQATLFAFTDLKLNSNPAVWRTLIKQVQHVVPGARWIGAVHAGSRDATGTLGPAQLDAARKAGMVRITTGLESGSQAVLDKMKKGTDLSLTGRFLDHARAAGISVRTTMIVGQPGETAADLDHTRRFLDRHANAIDRIQLNRLTVIAGTPLARQLRATPERFPTIALQPPDAVNALVPHLNNGVHCRHYRRSFKQLLRTVHQINRKPLPSSANDFEGVM